MAETTHRVAAQLTYRLRDGVLFGLAGERQIHSLTCRPGGPVTRIAPGRYGITEPTQHPVFGMIAFACPSDPSVGQQKGVENPTRPSGTNAYDLRPGGANAFTLRPGGTSSPTLRPGVAAVATMRTGGTNSYDLRPGGAKAYDLHPGATSAAGGFVLAKSSLGGNSLIVINGFEELMEALALSGGGSFDVVA